MSNDKREHTISTKMVGTVQGVGFTHAQFGQQYTTIEGVNYITYFDLSNPKLKGLKPGYGSSMKLSQDRRYCVTARMWPRSCRTRFCCGWRVRYETR